jgi:hypothetical protein
MPGESDAAIAGGTARDAFLGYTYQAEIALLELTRRRIASADPEWSLTIEVFDDVAFERDGSPEEFLQTKHSRDAEKDLGDHSVDLWKTIRNWSELVAKGVDRRTSLSLCGPRPRPAKALQPPCCGRRGETPADYLFASPALAERLRRCLAFNPTEWYAFSDHSPIVATFEV